MRWVKRTAKNKQQMTKHKHQSVTSHPTSPPSIGTAFYQFALQYWFGLQFLSVVFFHSSGLMKAKRCTEISEINEGGLPSAVISACRAFIYEVEEVRACSVTRVHMGDAAGWVFLRVLGQALSVSVSSHCSRVSLGVDGAVFFYWRQKHQLTSQLCSSLCLSLSAYLFLATGLYSQILIVLECTYLYV